MLVVFYGAVILENHYQLILPHSPNVAEHRVAAKSIRGIVVYLTPEESKILTNLYRLSIVTSLSGILAGVLEDRGAKRRS